MTHKPISDLLMEVNEMLTVFSFSVQSELKSTVLSHEAGEGHCERAGLTTLVSTCSVGSDKMLA